MAAEEDKLAQSLALPEHDLHKYDLSEHDLSEIVKKVRAQTPARLLAGRSGAAYRTNTQLDLREAHAAARDAVRADLSLFTGSDDTGSDGDPSHDFSLKWNLLKSARELRTKTNISCAPTSAVGSMRHP